MSSFSWLVKYLLKYLASSRALLRLSVIGKRQDDGYIFFTSPELKGFSLMLEPGEDKNIQTLMDAIHERLITYLQALHKAKHAAPSRHYEVKVFTKRASLSYAARLSNC
jgi:hypothetical protein